MIRLSAFRWLPPFAQGLARDLRVRWALEEAGLPYEVMLIGPDDQQSAAYRAMQPFGQVSNSHSRSQIGWGLGLTISKSLAEINRGHLILDSKIGAGTTASVVLPPDQPILSK